MCHWAFFSRNVAVLLIAMDCCLLAQTVPIERSAGSNQQPAIPSIQVYPTETIVDVTVTDTNGNPVRGLKKSNFSVEEDGKPESIRSFYELSSSQAQELPKLPPGTFSNRQTPSASGALNILILDFLNTIPDDANEAFVIQTRVRQAAEEYLKSMPPGTRFAVLQLSTHLRILQNFTSDPALLSTAAHAVGFDAKSAVGSGANGATIGSSGMAVSTDEEIRALTMDERCRSTLEALSQIAASVASIKGKKNVIWFTRGVAEIDDPSTNTIVYGGQLPDYLPDYHKTLALLKAAQIAIYPISAMGVGAPVPGYDLQAVENLSLDSLAEATGGVAYYNTNDLAGALGKAVKAGADYYTLSYAPPDTKFDGRHHTITVHADIPGVHLTYRDGYYAEDPRKISPAPALAFGGASSLPVPSPESPTTLAKTVSGNTASPVSSQLVLADPQMLLDAVQDATFHSAMDRGMPISAQLVFDVHVEPSTVPPQRSDPAVFGNLNRRYGNLNRRYKGKPLTRYAFRSSLPTDQLALATGDDLLYRGALDFAVAAFDANGKQVSALRQTLSMQLDAYGYKTASGWTAVSAAAA